ncbi:MAG: hypothetical protein R2856_30770 [Caldilineaceae bacterium]
MRTTTARGYTWVARLIRQPTGADVVNAGGALVAGECGEQVVISATMVAMTVTANSTARETELGSSRSR